MTKGETRVVTENDVNFNFSKLFDDKDEIDSHENNMVNMNAYENIKRDVTIVEKEERTKLIDGP